MQVRYTKGRQLCYKDHIINFPQDITHLAHTLPRLPEDTGTVIIRRTNFDLSRHVDFIVRRDKVHAALEYKMSHDPSYANIQLNLDALAQLPENGSVADRIPTCPIGVHAQADPAAENLQAAGPVAAADAPQEPADDDADEFEQRHDGVLNLGPDTLTEVQQIRAAAEQVVNGPIQYEQQNIVVSPFTCAMTLENSSLRLLDSGSYSSEYTTTRVYTGLYCNSIPLPVPRWFWRFLSVSSTQTAPCRVLFAPDAI